MLTASLCGAIPGLTADTAKADGALDADRAAPLISSEQPESMAALRADLAPDAPRDARIRAIRTVAATPDPPGALEDALIGLLRRGDRAERPDVLRAIARYRSRASVAAVIEIVASPDADEADRRAASEALGAMTGLAFASDEDWTEWWATARALGEPAWSRMIADGQARRAELAEARAQALTARVAEAYRRLHVVTPEEGRSELLAELIRSDVATLRRTGFDLAMRTLLNARQLGPPVFDAARERLGATDAPTRALAADLLDKMDAPGFAPDAAGRLLVEDAPDVAAALLRYLSRHPEPEALPAVRRWLGSPEPTGTPAIAAAAALAEAGRLRSPEDLALAGGAVRARLPGGARAADVAMLAQLGDLEALERLLVADRAEVVRAAGAALARDARFSDRLLDAAAADARLFQAAAESVARFRNTPGGLRALAALPAPGEEERARALGSVARSMGGAALLEGAGALGDAGAREASLRHVAEPGFADRLGDADVAGALIDELAEARLSLGEPRLALAALEVDPALAGRPTALALRAFANAWLDRVEETDRLLGMDALPTDGLLDLLERFSNHPRAGALADRVALVRADAMDGASRARFDALLERLEASAGAPSGPDASAG